MVVTDLPDSQEHRQEELHKLFTQLADMTQDFRQYADFLAERRALMHLFVDEKPGNNN